MNDFPFVIIYSNFRVWLSQTPISVLRVLMNTRSLTSGLWYGKVSPISLLCWPKCSTLFVWCASNTGPILSTHRKCTDLMRCHSLTRKRQPIMWSEPLNSSLDQMLVTYHKMFFLLTNKNDLSLSQYN